MMVNSNKNGKNLFKEYEGLKKKRFDEYAIEVKNLYREYTRNNGIIKKNESVVNAVNGVSFNVKYGEVFGLLGENGAGKTTIIKILITLLTPSSGFCKVLGTDIVHNVDFIRNNINFIFGGENGLYRRLSGRDNLRYFANLYNIKESIIEQRIDYILELVELGEAADRLVETYSKGMCQRLQIARGIINNPQIVFMDEPTIGLDPVGARMLRGIIVKLREAGITVVLTTHYLQEADELCDRMVIMSKGKIVAEGKPCDLKKMYQDYEIVEIELDDIDGLSVDILGRIQGMHQVYIERDKDNGKSILVMKHDKNVNIIDLICRVIDKASIIGINKKELTLEDVYINLVCEK